VSRTFPGIAIAIVIEIEIVIEIVTAIVIVAVIEIGIAIEIAIGTEIAIASTKVLAFIIPRIMAAIATAPMLTIRVTGTACSRVRTMAGAGRTMTLSALTSTRAGLLADCSRYSPTDPTGKLIEMALCAGIRRAIRTGSSILWAGAFAVSCLPYQTESKSFSRHYPSGVFFDLSPGEAKPLDQELNEPDPNDIRLAAHDMVLM